MAMSTVPHHTIYHHPAFPATVGRVAACAQRAMPHDAERLTKAVQLVFDGKVHATAVEHCWEVISQRGTSEYTIANNACTCEDYRHHSGDGNAYLCKHVAATWIYRRVQQRLAALDAETVLALEECPVVLDDDAVPCHAVNDKCPHGAAVPPPPLPEARASVNVRIVIHGREVQWTLRDHDEEELAVRLEALLARYPKP